ncbi:hypothetical protein [Faecalimicrobium dakarense]|uniref:hypothetical protein n=1 Tax=Faecalimicrobium dakarense TaxID=1301100 RepID=UPI0004BAF7DF|nr:hypothetical protein [[Clostridium] dakarense]
MINEVCVLSNYNKKYSQFLLKEIVKKEDNKLFICHEKLRAKVGVKENDTAKINLKFMYKYDNIFEVDIISLSSIKVTLDSKIYTDKDLINIEVKYKDEVSSQQDTVEVYNINDLLVPKFIPVSIYIKEIESYYTQYIKPDVLGFVVRDKYSEKTLDIDSLHYDNIERYMIEIQSSLNKNIYVSINDKRIDETESLTTIKTIDLSEYKERFKLVTNEICISQLNKKVKFTILKNIENNIYFKANKDLKWYEIDEIYSKENLSQDINYLENVFKSYDGMRNK